MRLKDLTVCDILVKYKLMTREELYYEKKYCGQSISRTKRGLYKAVIWPICLLMMLSGSFRRLVNKIARHIFIDNAIKEGMKYRGTQE